MCVFQPAITPQTLLLSTGAPAVCSGRGYFYEESQLPNNDIFLYCEGITGLEGGRAFSVGGVISLSPKEYEWISVSFVGLPSSSTRPPSRPAHRWGGAGVQMPRLGYFTLYCSYVNEMGTVTRPGGSYLEGDDITQLQV